MSPRLSRLVLLFGILGFLAACSSTSGPADEVTLLVTNATCDTQACTPLTIHAVVPKFTVPGQPPWGFLDIGIASSPSTCFTLPHSHTLTVTGPGGGTDITWTLADPIRLTAIDPGLTLRGESNEFVPANEPAWAVSFGGSSPVEAVASGPCKP